MLHDGIAGPGSYGLLVSQNTSNLALFSKINICERPQDVYGKQKQC